MLQRLQDMLDYPFQTVPQLALYRIVSDCGFDLKYTLKEHYLTIIATKSPQKERHERIDWS